jgi:SET domain-containing protein
MRRIEHKYPLYLKKTKGKGWGVFCKRKIPRGKVFEVAPIIYMPRRFCRRMSHTPVDSYRFEFWGDTTAIVLGYASVYNHSQKGANCEYNINRRSKTYSFYATKDIPAHTEILHDYNWDESEYKRRGMREA